MCRTQVTECEQEVKTIRAENMRVSKLLDYLAERLHQLEDARNKEHPDSDKDI